MELVSKVLLTPSKVMTRLVHSLQNKASYKVYVVQDELGANVLSIQEGKLYGTHEDRIVVLCANYDTKEDNPGEDSICILYHLVLVIAVIKVTMIVTL